MPCYHPIQAYRGSVQPSGKRAVIFSPPKRGPIESTQLPCGRCIGCRLERSRQWAIRCVHEADLHDDNCFLTLTYDEDHLAPDGSLSKRDWQLFAKKLRKAIYPQKFRFFMCGEYGEKLSRPHFHVCLFGYRPSDCELYTTREGVNLYKSDFLASVWGKGFVTVGDVTFESAAYVARYITKKITGDLAEDHYSTVDTSTGEYCSKTPEFVLMSRRPGIAAGWHDLYKSDLDKDFLTLRGVKMRPPKFYDYLTEKEDPEVLAARKVERKESATKFSHDNTPARLAVKETIKLKKFNQLKRGYENET